MKQHVRYVRTDDGVHLTDAGAELLVPPILDWVRRQASAESGP